MFDRPHRFTFRSKFPQDTIISPYFSLRYGKAKENFLVGIVVGKKVSTHAVDRNTIKRKLSEYLRPYLSDSNPFVLVFYTKPTILTASKEDILSSIEQTFTKIGIIH